MIIKQNETFLILRVDFATIALYMSLQNKRGKDVR